MTCKSHRLSTVFQRQLNSFACTVGRIRCSGYDLHSLCVFTTLNVYVQCMLGLYEHPSNKNARPTSVTGSMVKSKITDVDACTSWTVNFTEHLQAQAILSCSMTTEAAPFGATIRYKKGIITIKPPIFRSPSFTVQYFDEQGDVVREETKTFKYVGGGWYYEADEVARCVRDGKLESDLWGHEKSIIMMDTFDKVSAHRAKQTHACHSMPP